jgi:DNA primase catalytic subunit
MEDFDFNNFYQNHDVDLLWLSKPSQHGFRWRCSNGSWRKSKRRISSVESFRKAIANDNPSDIYFSTSSWLEPIGLPNLSDETKPHPILINHLIAFDIDFAPLSLENLEQARLTTLNLHKWIQKNYDYELLSISFSGSKGFHLFYNDTDRSLFSIENAKEREFAVKQERMKLLEQVLLAGFKVDPRITADTRRIIRLPGSIHGKTGLLCHRINLERLETNVESWINDVPSFFGNIDIPKVAKVKLKKVNQASKKVTKKIQENVVEQTYMIEVSNHLPGSKDRSSLIFWTPFSWGIEEECLQRLEDLVKLENLADSYIFSDGQRILFICPEAFTRAKIVKILHKIGMEKLSTTLETRQHYWVRISGIMNDDSNWYNEPRYISVIKGNNSKQNFSKAHLTLLSKLGLDIDISQYVQLAGNTEPSIRMVVRD